MNKKVLIVEDQFVEANDLQLMLRKAGYQVCGIARSVAIAQEMIRKERPGLVLLDIFLKGERTGVDLAKELKKDNIAFVYLSANSNQEILTAAKITEPYGFMVKPFREKDLLVTLEIAQYLHEHSYETKYRREADLIGQLERTEADQLTWDEKLEQIGKIIQQEIPFDYFAVAFNSPEKTGYNMSSLLRIGFDEYQKIGTRELSTISSVAANELTRLYKLFNEETSAAFFNDGAFEKITQKPSLIKLLKETFNLKSMLVFPMSLGHGETYNFCFFSRRSDTYNAEHIALFSRSQEAIRKSIQPVMVIGNFGSGIQNIKEKLASSVIDQKNNNAAAFENIVGTSHLLLNVFDQIAQVAPFDTAALLLGESGTGKERIADCIHNLSPRKNKAFVKINCATLPANLIESELFGHEKGSFTGATDKRIGKFEQANGGTIFLDEIGEMPVDLQVKLLRVLQEKVIESVGGGSSIKINVRVIAATNRNLEKEVGDGRFRLDLYYRLNVFPIVLPALRDRPEDIPALVNHFIHIYNRKSGKKITGVSDGVLGNLMAYNWPGNIRELENLIERSVLLTKGTVIDEIFSTSMQARNTFPNAQNFSAKTIHENEHDYIIQVLKKCNGKVWGRGGAAEMLNVPPSTLKSKMKKLGIKKKDFG